jgi:cardiolipin synthase
MDTLGMVWVVPLALEAVLAALASGHVVLHKRDVRAAIGWVGIIWLVPVLGPLLYWLLGINRIRRRAIKLRPGRLHRQPGQGVPPVEPAEVTAAIAPAGAGHLPALAALTGRIVGVPLTAGNRVEPLVGGDAAYPEMIAAIDSAVGTVGLTSYIFDHDRAGRMFAGALERAVERGVDVRVLVDAVGARYSRPRITSVLHERGVPVMEFMRAVIPWRMPYLNLRNHRKILVVDGRVGFTGGMNIRAGCLTADNRPPGIIDVHFRVDGPVVAQFVDAFAEDWVFTTGELLDGPDWYPPLPAAGDVFARGIADGPDEDFEKTRWAILGALSRAQSRVRIVTPYFLPDQTLVTALDLAALRGVEVDIVLPARSNLRLVQWASMAQIAQVLGRGCRVWLTPPPFDHTKLMVIDGGWSLIGSTNWDPRSLRLNFEFNVECYHAGLAAQLEALAEARMAAAQELTLAGVAVRPLPVRLRDGVARLFSPYL